MAHPSTKPHSCKAHLGSQVTAWLGPEGRWRVVTGSKTNHEGLAILDRSKDFVHWTKSQHPLHSANGTRMWECQDFFPVSADGRQVCLDTSTLGTNVKLVLKVSLDDTNHDVYTIGTYSHSKDVYTPDNGFLEGDDGLRFDYGKFYASKTFFDGDMNHRILWGWTNESSCDSDDIKKGWSGVLADVEISFEALQLNKAEKLEPRWTNAQFLCSRKGAAVPGSLGPFGLLVLASREAWKSWDWTLQFFSRSTFQNARQPFLEIHFLSQVDHSIAECFAGEGKSCITANNFYPTLGYR